jgi:hypothetical protein
LRRVIALIGLSREKGRWRRRLGAAGIAAAPGRAEQRGGRRKEGGEGEADQWDPVVSERKEKKKKKKKKAAWAGTGSGWWAVGPPGEKGRKG